ncbi:hypothetical protein SDC9_18929 [bioreactor metagenome]|uniref:Uncharacterized protein n=1 Tax=bioreactor metagenome TaxID=1076179 RepID=A0A644U1L2_9ZZZZ
MSKLLAAMSHPPLETSLVLNYFPKGFNDGFRHGSGRNPGGLRPQRPVIAARPQESRLLIGRAPPRHRVAPGEAAETADHQMPGAGVVDRALGHAFLEQPHPLLLGAQILGVDEGHVEELPHRSGDLQVMPAFDGAAGHLARVLVGQPAFAAAAEHPARELVKDDDEGKRPLGRLPPGRKRSDHRLAPEPLEPLSDLEIEARIVSKPAFRPDDIAPERDHGSDLFHVSSFPSRERVRAI